MRKLRHDPTERMWRLYRTAALWGSVATAMVLIETLPWFDGYVWVSWILPFIAARRRGKSVGLCVGIAVGWLRDLTAVGGFGITGAILGALGYLMG